MCSDSAVPCAGALKAYDKAVELHRRTMQAGLLTNGVGSTDGAAAQEPPAGPPVRLLNNAAVLHLRYGDLAAALPLMEQAVEARCLLDASNLPAPLFHAVSASLTTEILWWT